MLLVHSLERVNISVVEELSLLLPSILLFFEKWFNPFVPLWLHRKDAKLEASFHLLMDLHSAGWLMGGSTLLFFFPFFFGSVAEDF